MTGKTTVRLILMVMLLAGVGTQATAQEYIKSTEIINIEGTRYYLHRVTPLQTIYSLSKLYQVSEADLRAWNPALGETLKDGEVIRIVCNEPTQNRELSPRRKARTFIQHNVIAGETTYSIARRYEISIETLLEDNPGLDPVKLSVGQTLLVRKAEVGESNPQQIDTQIDRYKEKLNSISQSFRYHVVLFGETLDSLAKRFGVAIDDIIQNNDLHDQLSVGSIIRIPLEKIGIDITGSVDSQPSDTTQLQSVAVWNDTEDLSVAIMLPLSDSSQKIRTNFIDLYQGALLALEDLKSQGYSINVNLYDTQRNPARVEEFVDEEGFEHNDILIGPVYEECLEPVVDFARRRRIPIVSPLATLSNRWGEFVYQLSPPAKSKNDKLRPIFQGEDKNIVIITSTQNDNAFEKEITEIIGRGRFRRLVYDKDRISAEQLDEYISADQQNLFVVTAADEFGTEQIMAALSSIINNRSARTIKYGPMRVVGSTRLARLRNIERNLYFKLDVSYVSNYHADRSNALVRQFDARYLKSFMTQPTLYSYRGYDAVKLFVGSLLERGENYTDKLNTPTQTLLQAPYHFVHDDESGNSVNDQWVLVNYHNDYTITVE